MKLYRYRSPTELVFKELRYNELYLASPIELNDPLDLNGQLNFSLRNSEEIEDLVKFLRMSAVVAHEPKIGAQMFNLMTMERLSPYLARQGSKGEAEIISRDDFYKGLKSFYQDCAGKIDVCIDAEDITQSLDNLFAQFLNNSAAVCFSEKPDDFLMWSHYAGGHSGICLEFEVVAESKDADVVQIPLQYYRPIEGRHIEWKGEIHRIRYTNDLTRVRFIDFLPVFLNVGDVDLMHLSKSHWHPYANHLQKLFLEKLKTWKSEKEWRMVNVYFRSTLREDRIFNYNPRALTGVYFGARASEETCRRVRGIVQAEGLQFYDCSIDGSRKLAVNKST